MVKTQYTFIKVPLDPEIKNKYPLAKNFGPMDELYLGLMENKLKIKPELIGKPFVVANSEKHNYARAKFEAETSRVDYDEYNGSEDESGEYSGEDGDETDSGDEMSNDESKQFYLDDKKTSYEPKPWVSASYKKHDIPTLDQLRERGQINPRLQTTSTGAEPNQEDKKRELMFKFEILRKSYKSHADKIPDCTVYTPLEQMENMYESTKKHLKLDDSVDSNKKKLIYGCMFIEWLLGRFFKIDMAGFTRHQILNIDSYDKLLFELGEKSYSITKKEWPVEVRLAILILCNAAAFVVSKLLDGGALVSVLNTVLSPLGAMGGGQQAPKRRMRGPNIDPSELP